MFEMSHEIWKLTNHFISETAKISPYAMQLIGPGGTP
jgi:hypothetical protein